MVEAFVHSAWRLLACDGLLLDWNPFTDLRGVCDLILDFAHTHQLLLVWLVSD